VAKALEAGCSQDDSVKLAFSEFPKTCVDVAAKVHKIQSREMMPQLHLSSQAAGSYLGATWQILEFHAIRDERIAGIFTFWDSGKIDSIGKLEGDILETVNGQVDAAVQERFIEFFCEKTFAADFGQRHIENFVSCGFDRHEIHNQARPSLLELRLRPIGLPQCERASARAKV
jgi:hypothetical protein